MRSTPIMVSDYTGGFKSFPLVRLRMIFFFLNILTATNFNIPVDRLDQIQRYIGPEGSVPKVDKLGSSSWEAAKEKVKKSVREVAEEFSFYLCRPRGDGWTFIFPT